MWGGRAFLNRKSTEFSPIGKQTSSAVIGYLSGDGATFLVFQIKIVCIVEVSHGLKQIFGHPYHTCW